MREFVIELPGDAGKRGVAVWRGRSDFCGDTLAVIEMDNAMQELDADCDGEI